MKRLIFFLFLALIYVGSGVGLKAADVTTEKPDVEMTVDVLQDVCSTAVETLNPVKMAKARWLGDEVNRSVVINCPGCESQHVINVDPGYRKPCWTFNNNFDKPTFSPSLLVRTGKYAAHPNWYASQDLETRQWLDKNSNICHSFIKQGQIQFLNDSTHKLKGRTVDLPDILNT